MCNAVIPSSLHRAATSCAASIAAYGEDSSRSAFTFIPPVHRLRVSLPDKSVTCCVGTMATRASMLVSRVIASTSFATTHSRALVSRLPRDRDASRALASRPHRPHRDRLGLSLAIAPARASIARSRSRSRVRTTNVSLKDAKICATPKTSSPSRALGPTYVACDDGEDADPRGQDGCRETRVCARVRLASAPRARRNRGETIERFHARAFPRGDGRDGRRSLTMACLCVAERRLARARHRARPRGRPRVRTLGCMECLGPYTA